MVIHPEITQSGGIVSVTLVAQFNGAETDPTDKQRIAAYGDPLINLAGLMTDPADTSFQFTFAATEKYVGLTSQMSNFIARFMESIPVGPPNPYPGSCAPRSVWPDCGSPFGQPPILGPLDCITVDPVHAATVYAATIQARCLAAMTTLRAITPPQLTSLADATI